MRACTLLTTRLLGVLFSTTLGAAASAQLDADFTATPTTGTGPLTVSFTDTTTGGSPTAWSWLFGDGSQSTDQHPTHTYSCPGSYTVTMIAVVTFPTVDVETKDGSLTTGMVVGESDATLTVITALGHRVQIDKADIAGRYDSEVSIMPDGLLHTMSLGDLVQLMHFLERGADL